MDAAERRGVKTTVAQKTLGNHLDCRAFFIDILDWMILLLSSRHKTQSHLLSELDR
jgi:hypothetical protein